MSGSISSTVAPQVHGHHHHHRGADASSAQSNPLTSNATPNSAASNGPGASTSLTAPASSGIQKFASELQSILLSAQSGQPSAAGTTANDPATASDPAGATDPTSAPGQAGPVRHLADRLQQLLSNGQPSTASAATSPTASSGTPDSLQSVLDSLQKTLQQSLQAYAKVNPSSSTTTLTA